MAVDIANDYDFQRVITSNDRVVVKYFADWCGSCRLFAPKFKRLSNDERFAGITFLDINAEKNPEARKVAGVTNLPFFAIFREGQMIDGFSGSKEEAVVDLIGKLN